jgi:hypothetical protein
LYVFFLGKTYHRILEKDNLCFKGGAKNSTVVFSRTACVGDLFKVIPIDGLKMLLMRFLPPTYVGDLLAGDLSDLLNAGWNIKLKLYKK